MQAPTVTSNGHRPAWCRVLGDAAPGARAAARATGATASSSSGSRRLRRTLRAAAAPAAHTNHHLTRSAQPAPWPASPLQQQQQQQQEHTAARKPPKRGGGALPDQRLAAAIRACGSMADCLALLQAHAAQLDGMLISALVTQTVALHVAAQQRAAPALQAAGPSLWQRPQQEPAPVSDEQQQQRQQQTPEAGSSSGSQGDGGTQWAAAPPPPITAGPHPQQPTAAGSTRSSGKAALRLTTTYLRLLGDIALRSAASGGFRPQQFANVLWGLARLGHKPQPAWLSAYLAQAEQQLQAFRPRDFAQLLWAVATLRAVPAWHGSSFACAFFAASGPRLPWFGPQDLANALWGCTVLRVQPPPGWLAAAVAGVQQQWARFKPSELSITLLCLAKLGVTLQDPCDASAAGQPTQQQQRQSAASPAHTAAAAAAAAAAAGPAVPPGWRWLVLAAARSMPLMGPQEVANLLWGLAAGRAALHEQEVQALANQTFIILAQSATRSRGCTVSLTVCLWSLARLAWRPSLPQAQLLVRLLSEVLASGALDMRHTCVLLWSLGRLRLRPQAPAMHELLDRRVLAGLPRAGPAVVCMALTACRNLGWRPSKGWWERFYQDSLAALQAAAAPELITLLSAAAAVRPLHPTQPWWEAFWDSMGVELEATLQAHGLERVAVTRNLPKGPAGPALATAAAAAAAAAAGSDSGAGADASPEAAPEPSEEAGGDSSSSARQASPWLHMTEALQVVANLHAKRLEGRSPHSRALVTPRLAVQLLWACARLDHCPPQAQLWQLLLLLLANVHALPSCQLTCVAWSLGRLLERHGPKRLRCFALVKRLAMVAQWRLLAGLAPGGRLSSSSSDAAAEAAGGDRDSVVLQRRRYVAALRYLVRQGWLQPYMLTLSNSQQQLHEAAGRVGC